ncbi:2-succinyl-6-hydroxy-2,4-cyclohexadiene-1-carboxylate synthase [Photobacterium sp. TY1-4]|uniref:2-succinyl-6-hydroxy-2, 4-cyclohexadiene-1-carboxylate synthase n=1 Tax=Photobacterium sp. TY1-4 TaxID=2899122 RepID=UPI0021C096D6|nr:2-succinyl-6-hydroxy-2,4-cyclohexadiene-1-carboxylate synthase [Photobacterium sp. TY1-4]UXI00472.1 2-succinyl-6-hydroxy-2,4-cyclohexadiene-1-carboxylate synthase [Photobacterium sp. TY1-4]
MPLYSEVFGHVGDRAEHSPSSPPVLVFLHGLLGTGRDWAAVIQQCSAYPCLTIDLPGHGHSREITAAGFEDANRQIIETLRQREIRHYVLIGYSMGARLAMYHACQPRPSNGPTLAGLVLEGGHFGLPESQREVRQANDEHWAQRFMAEPPESVLKDWYRQPVFASLDAVQQQQLIRKRKDLFGPGIAQMLRATSLANQPMLLPGLAALDLPIHYLCGDKDIKFRALAEASALDVSVISGAGHNVHVERPDAFFTVLQQFLNSIQ